MAERGRSAVELRRGPSGLGLVVFLPGGRRAVLEPGVTLADLDDGARRELESGAAPLTPTEALFEDPDGAWWLAQATGPAWAEEGAAADIVGTRFTRLDGSGRRLEAAGASWARLAAGGPAVEQRREELLGAAWRAAAEAESAGTPSTAEAESAGTPSTAETETAE
ncbi:MAG: hypothetical protein RRA92_06500 [Gemmatimonadota bacterium]|nr:hypothetical protein [Gemmatimonadota bacterium]